MNKLGPAIIAPDFSLLDLIPADVPKESNLQPKSYDLAKLVLKSVTPLLIGTFVEDLPLIAAADPEYDTSDTKAAQAAREIMLASETAMFVEGFAGFVEAAERAKELFPPERRMVSRVSDLRGTVVYGLSGHVRSAYGPLEHAILAYASKRNITYSAGFFSDAGEDNEKEVVIVDQLVEKHKKVKINNNLANAIKEPLRRLPAGVVDEELIISTNTEVIKGEDEEKVKIREDPKVAKFRELAERFTERVIGVLEDRVDLDIGHPNAVATRLSLLANGWPKF